MEIKISEAWGRLKESLIREHDRNPVAFYLLGGLLLFFVIFILFAVFSGGKTIHESLWFYHGFFFSDYFDSIQYAYEGAYTKWTVIYPGFATFFYQIIGDLTIPFADINNPIFQIAGDMYISLAVRSSQMGMMSYLILVVLAFLVINKIIKKLTDNKNIRTGLLMLLVFIMSYPFINAIERGNNILLVVALCFIFLMGYRSENKWIRYASYIALGCAAGFKLFPAIFGLLIIRERKWKEALICIAIGVVIAFGPFIFTGGDPLMMIENILSYTSDTAGTRRGWFNIKDFVFALMGGLSLSTADLNLLSNVLMMMVILLSFIVVLFDKEMKFWKVVALISCNLIIGPGVGTPYIMVYIALPLVFFLVSERELSRNNIMYIICFVAIMALLPGFQTDQDMYYAAVGTLKALFVFFMTAALLAEGFHRLYKKRRQDKSGEPEEVRTIPSAAERE